MTESAGISWKRVTVEGVAIVVSILVAFAVDAAWETSQERRRLVSSLASLGAELNGNRNRLEAGIESLGVHLREIEDYVVLIADPTVAVSPGELRKMWGNLAPLRQFPLQRAAFEDLTSGGLQSISDGQTRRLILEYGQAMEFHATRQRIAEEWFDRRANPYDEVYGDLVGMRSAGYSEGWAGRKDLKFDFDPEAFIGNRRYANLLAARYFRTASVLAARETLLEVLIDLEQSLPFSSTAAID